MNVTSVCNRCFVLYKVPYHLVAFVAIGHTATAVGSDMKPFLDSIMTSIKQGLQGRGQVVGYCSVIQSLTLSY